MRTLILILGLGILGLVVAVPGVAQAEVSFEWLRVGDSGNACDTQNGGCFGSVGYVYFISKYEVTSAQYAEFLNAVAATDPYGLYSTNMGSGLGSIIRSGSSGSYTYDAIAGREKMPVNYVSFYSVLRFANWLHNGQPTGAGDPTATEYGAYTIIAETYPSGPFIFRNPGATTFLPSEDEWYKAAYYDVPSASYFDFPAGSDATTICVEPGVTENTANCNQVVGDLTEVGSYTESVGPNGTFDQGGNVWEWNEAIFTDARGVRGGSLTSGSFRLAALFWEDSDPPSELEHLGFRIASVPEPSQTLLHACALGTLALLRRRGRLDRGRPARQ